MSLNSLWNIAELVPTGSFMEAAKVFSETGMNITRISYNKAVDIDNIFVDADGDEAQHELTRTLLSERGFTDTEHASRVELTIQKRKSVDT